MAPDAEGPLQLGIGGAFCGSPGGELLTSPRAGPADPRADDPAGAGPDIAALPRKKVCVGRPCSPTRPVVAHWRDPTSCPSGSILWLPFGSGAPHGVVGEFYARSARLRKGFQDDSRELLLPTDSSTDRHACVPNTSPGSSTVPVNNYGASRFVSPWGLGDVALEGGLDLLLGLRAAFPAGALDGLAGLEVFVDL